MPEAALPPSMSLSFIRELPMFRRQLLSLIAAGLLSPLVAWTQGTWPNQPIKVINPFPTGGTVDQISRLLQPFVQQNLGQPIVIENKVGASGTIGTGLRIAGRVLSLLLLLLLAFHDMALC